jgi:hypothetical protein
MQITRIIERRATPSTSRGGDWSIVAEFTEVESGKRSDRPALKLSIVMKVTAALGGPTLCARAAQTGRDL